MSAAPGRGITVGVTGRPVRANVTPWGDVETAPRGSSAPALAWFVAAEDRWHRPADDTSVRQDRVSGTPVVGVSYNPKFRGFFRLIGLEHRVIDDPAEAVHVLF